jgi:hypothetical protein
MRYTHFLKKVDQADNLVIKTNLKFLLPNCDTVAVRSNTSVVQGSEIKTFFF